MTKSLADINALVRFRGDFRNTVRFPDTNVNTEIQAAWAEFYELVADTNQGYWDTIGTITTTASTAFVALPSDTWRVRGIDRLDSSGTVEAELAMIGISERNHFSSNTDKPRAYRLTARGVDLFPTPDAIYTLRITYTPLAPALSAAREFYNGWEEYVVYGALIRLAENEERDVTEWQKSLDRQAARVTRGASQRRAAEPEYIPLREGWGDDTSDERWR